MGRKPNQLVLEYYIRGAKLPDASNRYEYTCKACRTHFPKGRMDGLTNHLTRKCNNLSNQEKQRALLRLYNMAEQDSGRENANMQEDGNFDTQNGGSDPVPGGSSRNKQVGEGRDLTRLEVLAEASRQMEHPPQNGHEGSEEDGAIDPSLQDASPFDNAFEQLHEEPTTPTPATILALNPSEPVYISPYANGTPYFPTTSITTSPDLASIAASASDLAVPASSAQQAVQETFVSGGRPDPVDVYTELQALRPAAMMWAPRPDPRNGAITVEEAASLARAASYPRPIAISIGRPLRNNSGNAVTPRLRAQKIRGKFTDSRRKEVQEVRKKGACIRCRMLRKTCSNGEPCDSCVAVNNARLWKTPCKRTRVAAEFDLYTAGMYEKIAFRNADQVNNKYDFQEHTGQIILCHYEDDNIYMACLARIGNLKVEAAEDGDPTPSSTGSPSGSPLMLVNDGENSLSDKLDLYIKEITPTIQERASSPVIRATLRLATRLANEKKDVLLGQVLELWTTTILLVDVNLQWKVYYDPQTLRDSRPGPSRDNHPSSRPNVRDMTLFEPSQFPVTYVSLDTQLRAVAEQKASTLSTRILNEVERRLLQRSHCQGFETFLVAILLLNCTESMCFMFEVFAKQENISRWPLELSPDHYTSQGESFSEIMTFLLRLRLVLPKTETNMAGFLHPVNILDGAVYQTVASTDASKLEWFRNAQLTQDYLQMRREAVFDSEDPRSLELKYGAKLLL